MDVVFRGKTTSDREVTYLWKTIEREANLRTVNENQLSTCIVMSACVSLFKCTGF